MDAARTKLLTSVGLSNKGAEGGKKSGVNKPLGGAFTRPYGTAMQKGAASVRFAIGAGRKD